MGDLKIEATEEETAGSHPAGWNWLPDRVVGGPLEGILSTIPAPVVLHAGDGRIVDANSAARDLLRRVPLRAAARLEAAAAQAAGAPAAMGVRIGGGSRGPAIQGTLTAVRTGTEVQVVSVLQVVGSSQPADSDRLALLSELGRRVAVDRGSSAALLSTIVRRAAEVLGEMCILTLLTADERKLRIAAIHHRADAGLAEATRELFALRPYAAHRGPAGSVIATRRALRMTVPEIGTPTAPLTDADAAYLRRFGVRSWAIAPLEARGQVLGTLGLWRTAGAPAFAEPDLLCLQQVADLAAMAVANDRLRGEAVRRAHRLHALHLGQSAAGTGRHALTSLLDQLTRSAGLECAFVAQVDPQLPGRLRVTASAGGEAPAGGEWPVGTAGPLAHAMRTGLATTVELPDGLLAAQRLNATPAYVSPMVVEGRCLGVLAVMAPAEVLSDPEQTEFIDTVAGLAAMSVELSRISTELSHMAPRVEPQPSRLAPHLSRSEALILPLVAAGRSNREIAASVHLSENTVKFHVGNLLQKLGARNRVEAVRAAVRLGLAG